MDALILRCVLFVLFLCGISVSGHSSRYSDTREELLKYRTTPVDLFFACASKETWITRLIWDPLQRTITLEQNGRTGTDFSASCILCFMESWLCEEIRDFALQISSPPVDLQAALPRKATGVDVCFYINNGCTDVTVIAQHCSPSLEYVFIRDDPPDSHE